MSAMDFTKAAGRVRGLIASKKPQDLARSALTPDHLRDNIVSEAAEHMERFDATLRRRPTINYERENEDGTVSQEQYEWTSFSEAVRDVARAGYGEDEPELRRREQMRPSHQLNREVEASMFSDSNFKDGRPYTRGNVGESIFSAMAAADSLEESARTHLAEHIARSNEMEEAEDTIADAQTMLDNLRKSARKQVDDAGEVSDKTKRDVKGQVKRRQGAREQLANLAQQQAASTMVSDAIAAGELAAEASGDAAEAFGSLPGVDPGNPHNVNPDKQIELAKHWMEDPQLREILRNMGRWLRDWKFKRSARTKNVKVEPVSVTTGRDLDLMLPHELARAFMPETQPVWMKDYAERSLLVHEMQGKAPAGHGPIIECHDGSGSMAGEKFIWAGSIALTLVTEANKTKRAFAGIEFGSESEMKSWYFPAREPLDPDQLLDFVSHFFNGGTSTVTGMREALRIIREQPEFTTADIVLIGDGQDHFTAEDKRIRDELRALNVRIHGISIQCPNNAYFGQMCEYTIDIEDLAGSAPDELADNLT